MRVLVQLMTKLEEVFSAVFEGAVERIFKVRVEPAHVARQLDRAMEEGAMAGVEGLLAPNHYTVKLDSRSYQRLSGILPGLKRDMERHLVSLAARRRMRNLEPFEVDIEEDASLRADSLNVVPAFKSQPAPVGVASGNGASGPEHTIPMPVVSAAPSQPPALLELKEDDGTVRTFPLVADRCSIGRAMDNDVVLPESGVSRYHAAVRVTGEGYLLEDLGSTNGVLLNGKPATNTVVRDGDRLQVGTTELVFRHR